MIRVQTPKGRFNRYASVATGTSDAAALAARAAAIVTASIFYPRGGAKGSRPDLTPEARKRLLATVAALHDAANRLDPPAGSPDLESGLSSLREADTALRSIDESTLTAGIIRVCGEALALIEQADHAARTSP